MRVVCVGRMSANDERHSGKVLRSKCSRLSIHQEFYIPRAIVVAEGAHALAMLRMAAGHHHLPGGAFRDDFLKMLEEYSVIVE